MSEARDSFLSAGGARLRYRDEGSGPALLLLHGWAFDLEIWQPLARALAPRWRVLSLDRRGFGLSSGQPSLLDDAHDALALLDALGLAHAGLIGASQGARVALHLALEAPQRVRALVLDGPPDELGDASTHLTPEIPLEAYRALAQRGQMDAVRLRWSQHTFTRLHGSDPDAQARVAAALARYPGTDLLAPPSAPPPLRGLDTLQAPTLILNGAHDLPSRQAAGVALAAALPSARQHTFAAAGHLPHLDDPEGYRTALEAFLSGCGSPGTG